ncbi:hypothetical protein BH09ACT6_BH09ACT6_05920 [soil metagenome]
MAATLTQVISANVLRLIEANDLTEREVAANLEIADDEFNDLLHGEGIWTVSHLVVLLRTFRCDVADLMKERVL